MHDVRRHDDGGTSNTRGSARTYTEFLSLPQLSFIVSLGANPDECYNGITPHDMRSDLACAFSGALIVFGGWAAVVWSTLSLSIRVWFCPTYRYPFNRFLPYPFPPLADLLGRCTWPKVLHRHADNWMDNLWCNVSYRAGGDRNFISLRKHLPHQPRAWNCRLLGSVDGCIRSVSFHPRRHDWLLHPHLFQVGYGRIPDYRK